MSDKPKFPRAGALKVAKELCDALKPVTERLIVAGSLRRRRQQVGDVEILFIPKLTTRKSGFFLEDIEEVDEAAAALQVLLSSGVLRKRLNVNGSEMWGAKNKLAVHLASGIPVDLFTASEANWFNYLVCRTGGAEHNTMIASVAQQRGWKWNPYGEGFTDHRRQVVKVRAERDVFTLLDLPYKEPWER